MTNEELEEELRREKRRREELEENIRREDRKIEEWKEIDHRKERKYSRVMRAGSFVAGIGFLALGAVDAMIDPFPGPETFFAGTGVSLIIIGATGRKPNLDGED